MYIKKPATIRSFNNSSGYGSAVNRSGENVFIDRRFFNGAGNQALTVGQQILFIPERIENRWYALEVEVLKFDKPPKFSVDDRVFPCMFKAMECATQKQKNILEHRGVFSVHMRSDLNEYPSLIARACLCSSCSGRSFYLGRRCSKITIHS